MVNKCADCLHCLRDVWYISAVFVWVMSVFLTTKCTFNIVWKYFATCCLNVLFIFKAICFMSDLINTFGLHKDNWTQFGPPLLRFHLFECRTSNWEFLVESIGCCFELWAKFVHFTLLKIVLLYEWGSGNRQWMIMYARTVIAQLLQSAWILPKGIEKEFGWAGV